MHASKNFRWLKCSDNYPRILFVLSGEEANSLPIVKLEENSELRETVNDQGRNLLKKAIKSQFQYMSSVYVGSDGSEVTKVER